jgi:hypothetical protein
MLFAIVARPAFTERATFFLFFVNGVFPPGISSGRLLLLLLLILGRRRGPFLQFDFLNQVSNGVMQGFGMSPKGFLKFNQKLFRIDHNFF